MVLIPAISTLGLVLLFLVYYHALGFNHPIGDRQETTQRMIWGVSALLFSAALAANLSISEWVVIRHWHEPSTTALQYIRWSVWILTTIAAVGIVFFDVSGADAGALVTRRERTITKIHNVSAVLAVGMALTCAATLIDSHSTIPIDILRERLQSLRAAMVSTAALLTAGVFEVTALFRWKQQLASPPTKRMDDLAGAVSLGAGLLFSALLLTVFVPVVVGLSHRFDDLAATAALAAHQAKEQFSVELWRIENQVGDSPLDFFSSQVVILFPVTAGLLSKSVQIYLTSGASKIPKNDDSLT